MAAFDRSVFVNCPFDSLYAPLLEAAIFCLVYFGFTPRLANERVDSGENRLDKITEMISGSRYSIHDLSRSKSMAADEVFRMNMPFEFGMDMGFRRSGGGNLASKKFLIFENEQYDLKKALSDVAGQDVEHHNNDFEIVIRRVRDFFRTEAGVEAPGPTKLFSEYATFQGWMTEKKISEGHSEADALKLPTKERIDEMMIWVAAGKPSSWQAT